MEKMSKKPLQQRSQQRMEKAINSAILLIENIPLDQISIPEIAKHSDVPRSSIYQFFPTLTSLLNEVTQRQLQLLIEELQKNIIEYYSMSIFDILKDLISKTSMFYNNNHVASVLILNGSMSQESYNAQQTTIQIIAKNIVLMLGSIREPIYIPQEDYTIEHLVEITFSLMKNSYFKNGEICLDIEQDIFDICRLYLNFKGFIQT